jgi:hypothetical protein
VQDFSFVRGVDVSAQTGTTCLDAIDAELSSRVRKRRLQQTLIPGAHFPLAFAVALTPALARARRVMRVVVSDMTRRIDSSWWRAA